MPDQPIGSVERPKFVPDADPRKFEVVSTGVSAYTKSVLDANGNSFERKFIRGTASSNAKDRQGDILDAQCQAGMLTSAKGLTMFVNHSYNVPEDILGTCSEASLNTRVGADGGEFLDLDIDVMIDETNPRAVKSWQHISGGTKLAFSIGGIFKDFSIVEPEDDSDVWAWLSPDLIVHDLELLEISLVGIPANPRAYTKSFSNITKGLRGAAEPIIKSVGARRIKDASTRTLIAKSLLGDSEARAELTSLEPDETTTLAPAPTTLSIEDVLAEGDTTETEEAKSSEETLEAVTADESVEQTEAVTQVTEAPLSTEDDDAGLAADTLGAGEPPVIEDPLVDHVATPEDPVDGDAPPVVPVEKALGTIEFGEFAIDEKAGDGNADDKDGELKPVTDPKQQGQLLKGMRAMKRGLNHGQCQDGAKHLMNAHSAVKALLPPDFDIPANAALADDDDAGGGDTLKMLASFGVTLTDEQVAEFTASLRALKAGSVGHAVPDIESLETKRTQLQSAIAELERDRTAIEADRTSKASQVADLEEQLRVLRASSTGRRSASPGESHQDDESGDLVPIGNFGKSAHELATEAGRTLARKNQAPRDARSRVV